MARLKSIHYRLMESAHSERVCAELSQSNESLLLTECVALITGISQVFSNSFKYHKHLLTHSSSRALTGQHNTIIVLGLIRTFAN